LLKCGSPGSPAALVALKILKKYFEGGRLDDFSENTLRIEEKDEMMLLIAASLREINKNI
jgi:hypothetical protein